MFDNIQETVEKMMKLLRDRQPARSTALRKLTHLKNPTAKDCLVALFLYSKESIQRPDPSARIAPILFFQPHFSNIIYDAKVVNTNKGWTTLFSKQYEEIRTSPIFQGFPYIKTFTPMRRLTTSFAATTRFVIDRPGWTEKEILGIGSTGTACWCALRTESLIPRPPLPPWQSFWTFPIRKA